MGNIILGNKLDTVFDKNSFGIQTDSKGLIKSITVTDTIYKTVDSFGVGSSMDSLKMVSKVFNPKHMTDTRGKINLGKPIVYKGVTFLDFDEDNIIDMVWVYQ